MKRDFFLLYIFYMFHEFFNDGNLFKISGLFFVIYKSADKPDFSLLYSLTLNVWSNLSLQFQYSTVFVRCVWLDVL